MKIKKEMRGRVKTVNTDLAEALKMRRRGRAPKNDTACIQYDQHNNTKTNTNQALLGRPNRPGGGKGPPEKNHPDIIGGG